MATGTNLQYYHFIDAMRAVLISLGVVLHAAQIYNPAGLWIVSSDDTTWVAGQLVDVIHVFRMPAFFLVSGFLAAMSLGKSSSRSFVVTRLRRIGIPLISAIVCLNSTQALLLTWAGIRDYSILSFLGSSELLSHLWFLVNLIVYFVVSAGAWVVLRPLLVRLADRLARAAAGTQIAILLALLPILDILVLGLGKLGVPIYATVFNVLSVYEIFVYVPYFLVGLYLYSDRSALQRLAAVPVSFTMTLIAGITFLLAAGAGSDAGPAWDILTTYGLKLRVWAALALCLRVFYVFFDKPSTGMRAIADASYTIYLVHHVLVVALGIAFLQVSLPPALELCLVVVLTGVFARALHSHVVACSLLLLWLFNGRTVRHVSYRAEPEAVVPK